MKKKLEKLKMPEKRQDDMDLSDLEEGSPEEEASESPAEEQAEQEGKSGDEEHKPGPLDNVDDEDLLAEVKKRGLVSELEKGEDQSQEDNEPDFAMGPK